MTQQNIHIRFVGSSNMSAVSGDLAKINAELMDLARTTKLASVNAQGIANTKYLRNFSAKVDQARSTLTNSIMALDDFGIKTMKVADNVDTLTEKIRKQRFTLGDLVREQKNLKDVYRQQLANRDAMVMEWGRTGSGEAVADVITRNRNAAEYTQRIRNLRQEMGFYNQVLASVSDQTIKWGKNTQWAGRQLMAGLTMPIAATAVATGALAYQVDKGLTQIVKVYGDAQTQMTTSDADIRRMSMDTAKLMASSLGQSVQDTLKITAELAATGQEGVELQKSTEQVTRARVLGELDLQDAMQATMTLQSVYNMNSKELADTFNYMNSMENQTKLTMQDFAVGIPKVAGVIKSLGGDVREIGTLLAAMKIAGIDAAEGANAIKSISFKVMSPNAGTLKMFADTTKKDFNEVVKGADSVTERLIRVGEAMRGMDKDTRVGLIAKMFGLYQGSKALSIIDQLTDGSEQMSRALEISQQSTEQWAETANRELDKLTNSNWNKIQQAWQSLKIDLAEVGDVFLGMAVPLINGIKSVVEWFNNLGDGTKKFVAWGAAITAAIGPVIMLVGLMGNLIGNVGKFTSFIANLALKFQMLTDEEVAAQKVQRLSTSVINDEARAYQLLALQIGMVTKDLAEMNAQQSMLTRNQAASLGITLPGVDPRTGKRLPVNGGFAMKGDATATQSAMLLNQRAMKGISVDSAKTDRSWKSINASTGSWAMLAAIGLGSMATDSNTLMGNIMDIGFMLAAFGPMVASKISGPISAAGKGIKSKLAAPMKSFMVDASDIGMIFASSLRMMLGPLALAAAAVYAINNSIQHTRDAIEGFNSSAKTYAEVIGFTYREVGQRVDEAGNAIETLAQKRDKFLASNPEAGTILKEFVGLDDETKLRKAIGEGLKAAMHGATKEQAEEAAKIALSTMQSKLSEEQMTAVIRAKIDFGDMDAVIEAKIRDIQDKLTEAASNRLGQGWGETFNRWFTSAMGGDNGVNIAGQGQIKGQAQDMLDILNSATEETLPDIIRTMNNAGNAANEAFFQSMFNPKQKEALAKQGITSVEDIRNKMQAAFKNKSSTNPFAGHLNPLADMGLNEEQQAEFERFGQARYELVQELAKADKSLTDEQRLGIYTMEDYLKVTGRLVPQTKSQIQAASEWDGWQRRMKESGAKWSEQEKLTRLNILRRAAGMDDATTSAQGFEDATEKATGALRYFNFEASKTKPVSLVDRSMGFGAAASSTDAQQLFSAYQDAHTNAWNNIINTAGALAQEKLQDQNDALQASFQNARDALDAQQQRASDAFDNRMKRFDSSWEAKMDAFQKKWDKRKESTSKAYDTQIEKIRAQIKAEEDLEATRQKIFEAEKTRMSRMAEMANRGIDFNAALRTGNLDEAAKISNDMAAQQQSWAMEDAQAAGGDASKARTDALNAKVDALDKEKDAKLKQLDDLEAAEKDRLEKQKAREKELLDAKKVAMDKDFDNQKKNLAAQQAATEKANARKLASEQRLFQLKLETLKAWVPRDEKEMQQHTKMLEQLYADYGVDLTKSGKEWASIVGTSLFNSTRTASTRMSNDIAWDALGRAAAENMAKGAFNMTLSQFIKWVATGEMPTTAQVGYKGSALRAVKTSSGTRWVVAGSGITRHEGGMIGPAGKNKRTGFAGSQSPSEVNVNALIGESILNRRATRNIGADTIDEMNRFGGLPPNIGKGIGVGGPSANESNAMGAMVLGSMVQAFKTSMLYTAADKMNKMSANAPVEVGNDWTSALYPGGWKMPAKGPITSHFGYRWHPILKQWMLHSGADIGAPAGAQIHAARGGKVVWAAPFGGYGNWTMISHGGGLATGYAHQSRQIVKPGQAVRTGQTIGYVGSTGRSTGPHLHFEYMKNGQKLNPNLIIPGLNTGGYVVKEGLAKLHGDEAVLTKPLTRDLNEGIQNFADTGPNGDIFNFDFRGAQVTGEVDLERAIIKAMDKVEDRKGRSRTVGVRR